jgi:hypothetical protein
VCMFYPYEMPWSMKNKRMNTVRRLPGCIVRETEFTNTVTSALCKVSLCTSIWGYWATDEDGDLALSGAAEGCMKTAVATCLV